MIPILIKRNVGKYKRWPIHLYQCECGTTFQCLASRINNGNTKSCGCYKIRLLAEKNKTPKMIAAVTKHGCATRRRRDPTYTSWSCMMQRCTNSNHKNFGYYGGRGITVCPRWRESFAVFLSDMGARPPGTSIDRIDVNGNYEPGNCRWATSKEQAFNKRK